MTKIVEPAVLIGAEFQSRKNDSLEEVKEDILDELSKKTGFFIWAPSSSRHPRPAHMAFYGRTFSYKEGAPYIDEDGATTYILPGEQENCQCGIIELPDDQINLIGEEAKVNPLTNTIKIAGTTFFNEKGLLFNNKLTNKGYKKYQESVRLGGGSLVSRRERALLDVYYKGFLWQKVEYKIRDNQVLIDLKFWNSSLREHKNLSYPIILDLSKDSKHQKFRKYVFDDNGLFLRKSYFKKIKNRVKTMGSRFNVLKNDDLIEMGGILIRDL